MHKFALIVAGGSGSRMNTDIPKQFMELAGLPLLMHTFKVFQTTFPDIEFILVLPKQRVSFWNELCKKHGFNQQYTLAYGGENRFRSVKNGLEKISGNGVVFIHDGARPMVNEETLRRCFLKAREKGNALPVVPVSESVRYSEGESNKSVDRSKYYMVQTPQTFDVAQIRAAYLAAAHENFTDDASVLEATGKKIFLVDGNRENIKITFPEDLVIASVFLQNKRQ